MFQTRSTGFVRVLALFVSGTRMTSHKSKHHANRPTQSVPRFCGGRWLSQRFFGSSPRTPARRTSAASGLPQMISDRAPRRNHHREANNATAPISRHEPNPAHVGSSDVRTLLCFIPIQFAVSGSKGKHLSRTEGRRNVWVAQTSCKGRLGAAARETVGKPRAWLNSEAACKSAT